MKRLILASGSARRIEMLRKNGFDPEIMPADIDETMSGRLKPDEAVMYLAFSKAIHVAEEALQTGEGGRSAVVLAADTIVVYDDPRTGRHDIIAGKPLDEEDAFTTLSAMRGRSHRVITGVCLIKSEGDLMTASKECFADTTEVFFKAYPDEELRAYVRTEEPYDKAGGYAIQQTFGRYVDRIEGDYDNVVGLPWYRVEPLLRKYCR